MRIFSSASYPNVPRRMEDSNSTRLCLPAKRQRTEIATGSYIKTASRHQQNHIKISNFFDFLALSHMILKSKVDKVVKYYLVTEKLEKLKKSVMLC